VRRESRTFRYYTYGFMLLLVDLAWFCPGTAETCAANEQVSKAKQSHGSSSSYRVDHRCRRRRRRQVVVADRVPDSFRDGYLRRVGLEGSDRRRHARVRHEPLFSKSGGRNFDGYVGGRKQQPKSSQKARVCDDEVVDSIRC